MLLYKKKIITNKKKDHIDHIKKIIKKIKNIFFILIVKNIKEVKNIMLSLEKISFNTQNKKTLGKRS